MTTRVAVIQMVSSEKPEENLATAAALIREACQQGAEFCVLPENFPLMGMHEQDKLAIREKEGTGPIQAFLEEQAHRHHIWLMGGTIPLQAESANHIRAACLLYDPEGLLIARYDKMHLFDVCVDAGSDEVYNESGTIEAGCEAVVAKTPFANIGMTVCYDLRFPEMYRGMLSGDVNLFTVPSAFTYKTGSMHWEPLLRARAIENLCYVVASNQGGRHINERHTWGHSMIVDPRGEILASLESGAGVACADIDMQALMQLRREFPALEHRKI
ncbi:MAG: carbon-nitrogen hydrolase family protein [Pirellulales bacterium]|nr:carbon-nitrogen hydrolase family protein [Pirellulales bacterium]